MAYTDVGNRSTYIPGSPLRRRVPAPAAKMPMSQMGGFMGAPGMNMNGGNQVGMFHPGPSVGPGSPESIVTPQMNAQIAEMQARMRQQGSPLGTAGIRSFGASPNSGTFGMGSMAAPQIDPARMGNIYTADYRTGNHPYQREIDRGQLAVQPLGSGAVGTPVPSSPLFGQEARVNLGPTDQYGLRRPLGTGNITPAPNAAPGVLGMNGPPPANQVIGTLPGGATVMDMNGRRVVAGSQSLGALAGPQGAQGAVDRANGGGVGFTKADRRQAMQESNARWWASEAGKKQAAYLQSKQAARDANKSALRQAFMARKMGIPVGRGLLRPPSPVPNQSALYGYGPPVVTAPRERLIPGFPTGTIWPNPDVIGRADAEIWDYWKPAPPKRKIIPAPTGPSGAIPGPYPDAGW